MRPSVGRRLEATDVQLSQVHAASVPVRTRRQCTRLDELACWASAARRVDQPYRGPPPARPGLPEVSAATGPDLTGTVEPRPDSTTPPAGRRPADCPGPEALGGLLADGILKVGGLIPAEGPSDAAGVLHVLRHDAAPAPDELAHGGLGVP